jgi:hypothetical protein
MPAFGPDAFVALTTVDFFVIAIFLLGFTIFLLLQYRHFKRMEEAGPTESRDQEILDAIARLAETVESSRGEAMNVSVDMSGLEQRLDEIIRSHARLEEHMVQLADRVSAAGGEVRSFGLEDVIEQRLQIKGHGEVNVIGDLDGKESGEHRVTIETRKGSVPYKGYFVLRNGRIVDEHLQPIYEAFP